LREFGTGFERECCEVRTFVRAFVRTTELDAGRKATGMQVIDSGPTTTFVPPVEDKDRAILDSENETLSGNNTPRNHPLAIPAWEQADYQFITICAVYDAINSTNLRQGSARSHGLKH
jgi:hypothetical protein